MKKIPTLFLRDPENMSRVTRTIHHECHWVIDGEGRATRKWDGTCVMLRDGDWYFRRMVKPGKTAPPEFEQVDFDDTTGKAFGWVPADEKNGFWRPLQEALSSGVFYTKGTYELCGPKIQGNPEGFTEHVLLRHGALEIVKPPRAFDELNGWFADYRGEGLVFHHSDGRMAKIKRSDFGYGRTP